MRFRLLGQVRRLYGKVSSTLQSFNLDEILPMKSLVPAACVCAIVALVFLPPLFALAGMALGVGVIARGKMEHGVILVLLAAVCGYLGMSWSLSADDSVEGILWRNVVLASGEMRPATAPAPAKAATPSDWEIVSLKTRVTKVDAAHSLCSWKLVIRNDSPRPAVFHGSIDFQDAHGLELLKDPVNDRGTTQIAAASEGVFTGSQTISSTVKPARAVPMITKDN